MAQIWDADVALDEAIARGLIETQFPVLAPARLELLGEGWDNLAYRVNEDFVFRIPRRKLGADLIATEARFLQRVAPLVPVEIPVPEYFGTPAGDYPYAFLGYRYLAGSTGCTRMLTSSAFDVLASDLARFLSSLHAIRLSSELDADAPGDEIGRTDLAKRLALLFGRFEILIPEISHIDPVAFREFATALSQTAAWRGDPCWVHGDLYARHLLLDDSDRLCGVIDWGDMHRSDPALDLGIAWSYLPARSREIFRAEYGDMDDDTWMRARFNALHYAMALLQYGLDVGDSALAAVGRRALDLATEGSDVHRG